MIKVVILSNSLSGGGAEKVMLNIANNLDRKKFDLSMIFMDKTGDYGFLLPNDINMIFLKKEKIEKRILSLIKYLNEIKAATLLIWGINDLDTPFSDALLMESLIEDSGIVKVENAGHYSFLDNPYLVHSALDSFIKGEK